MPVPDFAPGEVLTAAAMDSIGLWRITPTVSGTGMSVSGSEAVMTNVASGEIRSVFSSSYRHYKVIIQHSVSTGLDIYIRMLSGTNTEENGTVYRWAATGWYAAGLPFNDQSTGANALFIGPSTLSDAGTAFRTLEVLGPNVAGRTWWTGNLGFEWTSNEVYLRTIAGEVDTATQYTGFKIYTSTGNMTGTIKVYGYN